LRKDIFNHRDILGISFFNCSFTYFLVNVYSYLSQTALKYLKDTEANINNVLILMEDFNIKDNIWDPNFLYHFIHSDLLTNIADSMNLCMSKSTNQVLTRYSDNQSDSKDLMFLRLDLLEFNNHTIYPDWRLSSDHVPLTVDIVIIKEHIQIRKCTITKNSEEEENFIAELIGAIKELSTENIPSKETLEQIVQTLANDTDGIWFKHSKVINITKHSKS